MGFFEDLELANKVFYPLLVIFGLPANALTIVVLARQRRTRDGARSTSSLYLIALAAADSLVLLFIVLIERVVKITVLDRSVSWGGFCPWMIMLDYTASNASTWIIIAYTMERFTGVFFPVWKHKVCRPVTAKFIIASVFCFSWLCSLAHFFAEEARTIANSTKSTCDWKDELTEEYRLLLIWGQSALSYIIPYILILSLNGLLIQRLRKWNNARVRKVGISANVSKTHRGIREGNDIPGIRIYTEGHDPKKRDSAGTKRPERLKTCYEDENNQHDKDAGTGKSRPNSRVNKRDCRPSVSYVRADSIVKRRRRNKPVYVLLGVSVAFVLLWLPRFISFLVLRLSSETRLLENFSITLATDIANMLALLNSSINIFLYSFVDERFRGDLKKLLTRRSRLEVPDDATLPPLSHDTLGVGISTAVDNTRPFVAKSNRFKSSAKRIHVY